MCLSGRCCSHHPKCTDMETKSIDTIHRIKKYHHEIPRKIHFHHEQSLNCVDQFYVSSSSSLSSSSLSSSSSWTHNPTSPIISQPPLPTSNGLSRVWKTSDIPVVTVLPIRMIWDILTIVLTMTVGLYSTHARIRNRCFEHFMHHHNCSTAAATTTTITIGPSMPLPLRLLRNTFHRSTTTVASIDDTPSWVNWVFTLYDVWCIVDIILNVVAFIVTSRRRNQHHSQKKQDKGNNNSSSTCYCCCSSFCTVDTCGWVIILLLEVIMVVVPWETILVQPLYDIERRETLVDKIRKLIKLLPKTKQQLCSVVRLGLDGFLFLERRVGSKNIWTMIGLLPGYIAYLSKMKGILLVRMVRYIHRVGKLFHQLVPILFHRKSKYL